MKAVIELGGKQYLIEPGTIFLADRLPAEKGEKYTTDRVLMILDDDDVVLGKPYIDGAKVTFSVLDQTKRRKIIVQKFRSKKGFLKTRGHRQHATQVQVELIEGGGKKEKRVVEKKKKKTTKKSADKAPKTETKKASDKAPKTETKKAADKAPKTEKKKASDKAPKTETKKASDKAPKTETKKASDKAPKAKTKKAKKDDE